MERGARGRSRACAPASSWFPLPIRWGGGQGEGLQLSASKNLREYDRFSDIVIQSTDQPLAPHRTSARKYRVEAEEISPKLNLLVNIRFVVTGVHALRSGETDRTTRCPAVAVTVTVEVVLLR